MMYTLTSVSITTRVEWRLRSVKEGTVMLGGLRDWDGDGIGWGGDVLELATALTGAEVD